MLKKIITWDLGATKCAAGLVEFDVNTQTYHCKKSASVILTKADSLANLIYQLELQLNFDMQEADAICIGAAGQYDGKKLMLVNGYPYEMNFAEIAKQKKWGNFAVIHDYAPVVCATFTACYMNNEKNVMQLNNNPIDLAGRRIALGLGTGLGMKDGVLFDNGEFWLGKNEIGHIGIVTPPTADKYWQNLHADLIQFLQLQNTVTFEKILSGPGLTQLYQFFYPNSDVKTPEKVANKISEGHANEMLDAFAWYLGLLVGTVQLAFMPEAGIWLTGGVLLHHLNIFKNPNFMKAITASPAYLSQREHYPLGVLCNPQHALIGGAYYAVKRLIKEPVLNSTLSYATL